MTNSAQQVQTEQPQTEHVQTVQPQTPQGGARQALRQLAGTASVHETHVPSALVREYRRRLLKTNPLVQFITNTVVQNWSANVLLAVGAAPAMIDHEADAADFASVAGSLVVNFGTPTSHKYLAAHAAIDTMNTAGKPWVLDPVGFGVSALRSAQIKRASRHNPTVIRGNASEIAGLAHISSGGRGVDSTDEVDEVLPAAIALAGQTGGVVAVSGPVDAIVSTSASGPLITRVAGGHPLMAKVIGTGCALGGLTAAYLAANPGTAHEATVAAHAHFAAAGARAGMHTRAPGSFAVAFLDALYTVTDEELTAISVQTTR